MTKNCNSSFAAEVARLWKDVRRRFLWFVAAVLLLCPSPTEADESIQPDEIQQLEARLKRLEAELVDVRRQLDDLKTGPAPASKDPAAQPVKSPPLELRVLPGDWGGAVLPDIGAVCRSASNELLKHCSGRQLDPISVSYSRDGPMVLFGRGGSGEYRVLLNAQGNHWAQFSYQYAHELCHILCNYREAENPNRWFEESLCEAASYFALRRMAETWQASPPYPNWKSYAGALKQYSAETMAKHSLPNDTSLADWYAKNETALRKTGTDRAKNQIVAKVLLPLIERQPDRWEAVGYLNQATPADVVTLQDYLSDWHRRVPDKHKPFVAEIAELFKISLR